MYKVVFAAVTAFGLIAAPLPALSQSTPAPAAPAKTEAKKDAKPKKAPSAGVVEMRARQTKCAAEWKEAKAAGKVEKGQKWPQFWSACNKRLKGA